MKRIACKCSVLLGGLALLGGMAGLLAADADPKEAVKKALVDNPPKLPDAGELKKRYPFVALKDRLDYEKAPASPSKLTDDTRKRLDALENQVQGSLRRDHRLRSLRMLHDVEVKEFTERERFGVERMIAPRLQFVDLPPAQTILIARGNNLAENEDEQSAAPLVKEGAGAGQRLPSIDKASALHLYGQFGFLNIAGFGVRKDRDRVAGFEPHQFRHQLDTTVLSTPDKQGKITERWLLRRLELVSLLKHERPVVYVSDHLPRMEDLKKSATRPLIGFEDKALKSLRDGEDLVTEATPNRIRMVGSLRATKQCLDCHKGQRGDLLGSFTYELHRDPPIEAKK